MEIPSPTRQAAAVADRLASILREEGFEVERPEADWPEAPAVVARLITGKPGRVLQFDGHLDTVHLPYAPPRLEERILYGQGASDMKCGLAAAVEAMRVLRDTHLLACGGILLTAHDHHEAPWGDSRQIHALIEEGYVGDGILIPEYLSDRLPIAGKGLAIFQISVRREGERVHEVFRPAGLPDVIVVGAEVVRRLKVLDAEFSGTTYPYVGSESVFIGEIHGGELYNQSPTECHISGTRRWVAGHAIADVQEEYTQLLREVAEETGTTIDGGFLVCRDGFKISETDPLVLAVQSAHEAVTGRMLPLGAKPFVDDGNSFTARTGVPAISHGPAAEGAHTTNERVALDELARVAAVYALTATIFCRVD
jgi:acetylornithine deacetylase/succinyl-diaminopimelate desuccinylase-like protein